MKRTCNSCRAWVENDCLLDFRREQINVPSRIPGVSAVTYKPLEECLKPMTNQEFIFAQIFIGAMKELNPDRDWRENLFEVLEKGSDHGI